MRDWLVETFNMEPGWAQGIQFFIAILIVLALISMFVWILRRVAGGRVAGGRSRQPRVAVMDAASLDTRRRLVLIRRDNVEHLLLVGGPSDVVVERNIVRGVPVSQSYPRQQAASVAAPVAAGLEAGADLVAPPTVAEPAPAPQEPQAPAREQPRPRPAPQRRPVQPQTPVQQRP
ncbi:flagellar biosynthetic protein FliO, partial [Stappia indica]|uniref:flagellar biosynthetic protein FliO n=1 Tax=Stappia indica TaxID=538381 RepID=UPI001CD31B14